MRVRFYHMGRPYIFKYDFFCLIHTYVSESLFFHSFLHFPWVCKCVFFLDHIYLKSDFFCLTLSQNLLNSLKWGPNHYMCCLFIVSNDLTIVCIRSRSHSCGTQPFQSGEQNRRRSNSFVWCTRMHICAQFSNLSFLGTFAYCRLTLPRLLWTGSLGRPFGSNSQSSR